MHTSKITGPIFNPLAVYQIGDHVLIDNELYCSFEEYVDRNSFAKVLGSCFASWFKVIDSPAELDVLIKLHAEVTATLTLLYKNYYESFREMFFTRQIPDDLTLYKDGLLNPQVVLLNYIEGTLGRLGRIRRWAKFDPNVYANWAGFKNNWIISQTVIPDRAICWPLYVIREHEIPLEVYSAYRDLIAAKRTMGILSAAIENIHFARSRYENAINTAMDSAIAESIKTYDELMVLVNNQQ